MTPQKVLKKFWGYEEFREPQNLIIQALLEGKDTVALLPTGGGKSICFQVPALIKPGIALVVSPLIALMQDQVENLKNRGIQAKFIQAGSSQNEILTMFENLRFDKTKLLYLSPERLKSALIREKLKQITISMVVVDEAHCISEWGHDFRPSFLDIHDIKDTVGSVPFIALTATANRLVLSDIVKYLQLDKPRIFKKSFERKNLAYQVFEAEDKMLRLVQIATKMKSPVIVYTQTRKRTQEVCDFLNFKGFSATYYHGGMDLNHKKESFNQWMSEDKRIMVATNAFGMGIDKENVQVVVHMDIPRSIENYFQEAGRAGRNNKKAFAALLWNQHDLVTLKKEFDNGLPSLKFIKLFTKKLFQHFDIAQGELIEESFHFDFYEFCQRHEFPIKKSQQTIQILNNHGVLEISKDYDQRSSFQLLMSLAEIQRQIQSKALKNLLEVISRNYTGFLHDSIKIDEFKIAKKLGITSEEVKKQLSRLHEHGLGIYLAKEPQQTVQFLLPREDDYMINTLSKSIRALLNQKKNKLDQILNYVQNKDFCRNRWLLTYFEESPREDCGICDICLSKKVNMPKNINSNILALLSNQVLSSQEIVTTLDVHEKWVILALKQLLREDKIRINIKNQYVLNEKA